MKSRIALFIALATPVALTSPPAFAADPCQQAQAQAQYFLAGYQRCWNGGRVRGSDCGNLTLQQWINGYLAARDRANRACSG